MTETKQPPQPVDVKPLEFDDWVEHASSEYLTIDQLLALSPEQEFKFLCLDRNACDLIIDENKSSAAKQPQEFFCRNYVCEFTRTSGISGTGWITFHGNQAPVEDKKQLFMFHIEFLPDCWYPLDEKGNLTVDPDDEDFVPIEFRNRNWSSFPGSTRLGWRGPMVPWDALAKLPPVFL